jgi:DNA modification methylase
MSFPWRKENKKDLLKEYKKLSDRLDNINEYKVKFPIQYLRTGMKCSNYFFQKERIKTKSQNKISCYDYWFEKKDKIIKYNKKNKSHDLFTTIVFLNHAPSQFPLMTAGIIYKYFGATKILDPYAGWGDRCIAAMAMNIDYIGIDSNKKLKPLYDRMINYYPTDSKIEIIYDKSENVNLKKLDFDLIFSSPPFWNKKKTILLEKYHGMDIDYDSFIHESLINLITTVWRFKPSVWICLNITKDMYDDIKKIIGPCKKIIKFKTTLNTKKLNSIFCF